MNARRASSWTVAVAWGAATVGACAVPHEGGAGDEATGTLQLALGGDGPVHDVAGIYIAVVDTTVSTSCAGPTVAEATVGLEVEGVPDSLETDGASGDEHPFASDPIVLPSGNYLVCATPLDVAGDPSTHCLPTQEPATVSPEATTRVVVMSQCLGDPNGGLDVDEALNDPPTIDDLTILPATVITTCNQATITVGASDPDMHALSYNWSVASTPAGASPTLSNLDAVATFEPDLAGDYELLVVVTDIYGAEASLQFSIQASADPC